jgi:hypothetical protein
MYDILVFMEKVWERNIYIDAFLYLKSPLESYSRNKQWLSMEGSGR